MYCAFCVFVYSFVCSFIHSFVCSFRRCSHLFVRSLVRSLKMIYSNSNWHAKSEMGLLTHYLTPFILVLTTFYIVYSTVLFFIIFISPKLRNKLWHNQHITAIGILNNSFNYTFIKMNLYYISHFEL